jgi:hypothetical protein
MHQLPIVSFVSQGPDRLRNLSGDDILRTAKIGGVPHEVRIRKRSHWRDLSAGFYYVTTKVGGPKCGLEKNNHWRRFSGGARKRAIAR